MIWDIIFESKRREEFLFLQQTAKPEVMPEVFTQKEYAVENVVDGSSYWNKTEK